MIKSKVSLKNNKEVAGTTSSRIVIEAERLGDPGTRLCLLVDTHLIASNLTTSQIKILICELLDRIEIGEATDSSERQLH